MRPFLLALAFALLNLFLTLRYITANSTTNSTVNPQPPPRSIVKEVIGSYRALFSEKARPPRNQYLAFGYVSDNDLYVDALQLLDRLGLAAPTAERVKAHPLVTSKTELAEAFAHVFHHGEGVELFVKDKELFSELLQLAR